MLLVAACGSSGSEKVDRLNRLSYDFHYRDLDSTLFYAEEALKAADVYNGGKAEAYNNKAFVSIVRMDYEMAKQQLDSVVALTDNQVELLVADIQNMRLCQRQSHNKDFYTYRESALSRNKRIGEEEGALNEHQRERMVYARSELAIVTSTYYYYVGLDQQSAEALDSIDPNGEILGDNAQLLNYLYNIGAGGIISYGTQEEINQVEMDYLLRCYDIALQYNYPFWVANSLQAMSEHLQVPVMRQKLIADNYPAIRNLNIDNVPDSLLAGNLAERSLNIFLDYGDVYQTAGSYRTLAQCYWYIGDYQAALECLNAALYNDSAIFKAPDLVASIREELSVVYAALNNKEESNRNRSYYIDTQDKTRQDLYLESRAEQLDKSVGQLNAMIVAIVIVMAMGVALLFLFSYLRRREDRRDPLHSLLEPLEEWKKDNEAYQDQLNDRYEETMEKMAVCTLHVDNNKRLNLEQRAKVSLVNMVTPYIDRILLEIKKLNSTDEGPQRREERFAYIAELADRIIDYNDILTQWIQLRKGELSLHIESFPIQALFDIVALGKRGFQMKGIQLRVVPSEAWVKADRTLTLFMINTIADNARKFTDAGGAVTVEAKSEDKFVEVSITDTGIGMTEQQVQEAFSLEKKAFHEEESIREAGQKTPVREHGHGFGLVNCKGIIEKYKKISSLFSVCDLGVESLPGKGSRFFFRLPKGMARLVTALLVLGASMGVKAAEPADSFLKKAGQYAEKVSASNADDRYKEALQYADSALWCFNRAYRMRRPGGADTLMLQASKSVFQSEILWFHDGMPVDFDVIRKLRNDIAVAALALHEWAIYRYNNRVYTQLYKEMSADRTLGDYCRMMQQSQNNKNMAIVILIILSLLILMAYFLMFYRHQVYYRFCLERVRAMNEVLRSQRSDVKKLAEIQRLAGDKERLPEMLQQVADELVAALKDSIEAARKRMADIDIAEDEVRKCEFENDKLHVCNSVLDNCLSTLKHETMYYPSRIRTLIDRKDEQLQSVSELADYYKELYAILSLQAMRQVESVKMDCVAVPVKELLPTMDRQPEMAVMGDRQMLTYLFELLKKQGGKEKPVIHIGDREDKYVDFLVEYPKMKLTDEECHELFNPAPDNLPFLLCRQIVRDVGETTNARGCGIRATNRGDDGVQVVVTLVKARNKA